MNYTTSAIDISWAFKLHLFVLEGEGGCPSLISHYVPQVTNMAVVGIR